jgi:hypothetical protein
MMASVVRGNRRGRRQEIGLEEGEEAGETIVRGIRSGNPFCLRLWSGLGL